MSALDLSIRISAARSMVTARKAAYREAAADGDASWEKAEALEAVDALAALLALKSSTLDPNAECCDGVTGSPTCSCAWTTCAHCGTDMKRIQGTYCGQGCRTEAWREAQ